MVTWYAGIITLAGALIIFIIAIFVVSAHEPAAPAEKVVPGLYHLRAVYFFLLLAGLAVFMVITLPRLPYSETQDTVPELTVNVVGRMWSWQMDPPKHRQGEVLGEAGAQIVLPVGKPVEFQVGAADVNHGFGIYNDQGRILAQVQAMPGYINRLLVTFDAPGTYQVLCMEYCGMAHHRMMSSFKVE